MTYQIKTQPRQPIDWTNAGCLMAAGLFLLLWAYVSKNIIILSIALLIGILIPALYVTYRAERNVPSDCIEVDEAYVTHGPATYYDYSSKPNTTAQLWKIDPQNHSIETQLGSFLIGWEPKPERFLDFVNNGADAGVKAKIHELVSQNAEIIQNDVLAVDEDGKLRHEPAGLLKAWAEDMGVVWRNVHVPTRWKKSFHVDSWLIEGAKIAAARAKHFIELQLWWDNFLAENRDVIEKAQAEREARGETRPVLDDLRAIFDKQEGAIYGDGVPIDNPPKEVP